MGHLETLSRIRHWVDEEFRRRGVPDTGHTIESILVRDGFYCGRCFTCQGLRAVWFVEEHVIKVFGPDGEFLDARQLDDEPSVPQRKAA